MPKLYGNLDLKSIREECGLDFAHFTFKKGMCSCCYGPTDLPARYWHNNQILHDKTSYEAYNRVSEAVSDDEFTYLLFKNADNGSGHVRRDTPLKKVGYVCWGFPMSRMPKVCQMLQEQVGDEYEVIPPKNSLECITIKEKERTVNYGLSEAF